MLGMLHVYCGSDVVAVRTAALAALAPLEEAGAVPVRLEAETYEPGALEHALGELSLFGGTGVYLLDTPSDDEAFLTVVRARLSDLAGAGDVFVLIESSVTPTYRNELKAIATTFSEHKAEAAERGNPFALGEAFLARDKKALWVQLITDLRTGAAPEQLSGMLWAQLRAVRLAQLTKTAEEAGMKDYSYKKAKAALRKYTEADLERLSHELLTIYHDAHAGKGEMAVGLERWCLGV